MRHAPARHGPTAGFGLVEVMVAMVIGMITMLAILQTLSNAEGMRRAVFSGADANTNGAIGLQMLQREVLNAGYGLALDGDLFSRCAGRSVIGYNADRSPPEFVLDPTVFAPIVLNPPGLPAADADTDVVQIAYSGSLSSIGRGVAITSPSAAATVYAVTSGPRAAFHAGDLAIAVEADKDCVISQVTQLPNGAGNPDECGENGGGTDRNIVHNNGNFRNSYAGCAVESARWNKPGGLGVHIADGKLFSLGPPQSMVVRAYAVRSGRLTVCNPLLADCTLPGNWEVVAEGVVSLRAQYGYDLNGIEGVTDDEWVRSLAAVPIPIEWSRLKAMRVALVSRANHFERDVVAGDCTPDWAGQTRENPACALTAEPGEIYLKSVPDGATNWDHYRYKLFQTTIPARNLFWSNNLEE